MPDKIIFKEQTGSVAGIYQQPSAPPDLSQRFMQNLHNLVIRKGMPHTRPRKHLLNGVPCGSSGNNTVYGLGIWRGTPDELIVACGTHYQKIILPKGSDPTDLTTNYPTGWTAAVGARTITCQLNKQMFIVNGSDSNIKYNGTNLTRMGLVAPATLGAPSATAGVLNGVYSYKATLVSATTYGSQESEGSAALSVTYATQQGTFSVPTVPSADPQIDRWNLYRAPQGDTTTYYRVNTSPISSGTTIADNLTDTLLIAGTKMSATATNTVPSGAFNLLTTHQGRLVGVYASNPNTLFWSDQGLDSSGIFFKPESWPPVNRLPFGEQGGTEITALASFFEYLVVFQDFGTWSITGTLANDADRIVSPLLVAPDTHGVGVSDQGNVAVGENKLIFAGKSGLYQIIRESGTIKAQLAIKELTSNIKFLYQQIDFSSGGSAIYDRDQSRWVFWGKGKQA